MTKFRNIAIKLLILFVCIAIVALHHFWDNKHINGIDYKLSIKNIADTTYLMARSHKGVLVKPHEYHYFTDYVIVGNPKNVASIISGDGKTYSIDESKLSVIDFNSLINVADTFKRKTIYSINAYLPITQSKLPYVNRFANWNGDFSYFKKILLHPLLLLISMILLLSPYLKKLFSKNEIISSPHNSLGKYSFIITAILLTIGFAVKIIQDKYYFLQDDNYAQFTPIIVRGIQDWYQYGTMPTYNPYQFAGVPTAEISTYALYYPLSHISFIISKYILGNLLHFNNVFAYIHFLIGAYFTLKILDRFSNFQLFNILASVGFVLCGFNLEAGRSWYYVTPMIAFLPLLIWLSINYNNSNKPRIIQSLLIGVCIACFAYGGNFQLFCYTILFAIGFQFIYHKINFKQKLFSIIIPLVTAGILFSPQLITTFFATKNIDRNSSGGETILNGIGAIFTPYLFNNQTSIFWGQPEFKNVSHFFYHGNFVALLLSLIFIIVLLVCTKTERKQLLASNNVLKGTVILFVIALLLSFGRNFIFWPLLNYLPVLNKFTLPFKFLPFVQFFGTICGAILLSKIHIGKKLKIALAVLMLINTVISVYNTNDAFSIYAWKNNNYTHYSFLDKIKSDSLYRIYSFSPSRTMHKDFNKALDHNLPTMHGLNSIHGYEPLFEYDVNLEKDLSQYSVKYIFHSTLKATNSMWECNRDINTVFKNYQLTPIYKDSALTIYENKDAQPIVTAFNKNDSALAIYPFITNKNNGVQIDFEKPIIASKIILAYHFINGLQVFVNGKKHIANKDSYGRIQLNIASPVQKIETKYRPYPF